MTQMYTYVPVQQSFPVHPALQVHTLGLSHDAQLLQLLAQIAAGTKIKIYLHKGLD